MITQAVFSFFGALAGWVLDIIPDGLGVPGWLDDGVSALMAVFQSTVSLAVWIPIPIVVLGAGFRIAVILGSISVKSLRVVVSLFSGGGGSTG